MEERLRHILSTVNSWLEFAEKKNGALLVADSAVIFGILSLWKDKAIALTWVTGTVYGTLLLLILSALGCLISFIPRLRIPWLASRRKSAETDNLLFYGDIATYDPAGYLQALYKRYNAKDEALPIEEDYAQQIVMNSRIATRKYEWFNAAVCLAIGALLALMAASAVYIVGKLI